MLPLKPSAVRERVPSPDANQWQCTRASLRFSPGHPGPSWAFSLPASSLKTELQQDSPAAEQVQLWRRKADTDWLPSAFDPLTWGTNEMRLAKMAGREMLNNQIIKLATPVVNAIYSGGADRRCPLQAKPGMSIFSSAAASRSLLSARASICRIRSFVTPSTSPTSLRVSGSWE